MKKTKIRKLAELFGVYAGASWGGIEFSQFLSNNFLWSPHVSKLVFWVAVSLLPLIIVNALIFSDSDDEILNIKHNKIKKIIYITNIGITIAVFTVCIFAYDLSPQLTTVQLTDESGNISNEMQVKDEYIKSLAIFSFDNKSENESEIWLSYGLAELLNITLKQDLYIKPTNDLFYFAEKKGYLSSLKIPLAVKAQIAKEAGKKYFISGLFERNERGFNVNITLYETESITAISSKYYSNNSVFKLIDEVVASIRKDIGNPAGYLKNSKLLPSDLLTTQFVDAFREYSLAGYYSKVKKDINKAKEHYYSASNIDNQFNEAKEGLIKIFESNYATSNSVSQNNTQSKMSEQAYKELYEKLKQDMNNQNSSKSELNTKQNQAGVPSLPIFSSSAKGNYLSISKPESYKSRSDAEQDLANLMKVGIKNIGIDKVVDISNSNNQSFVIITGVFNSEETALSIKRELNKYLASNGMKRLISISER